MSNWISVKVELPEHGQNCSFVTTVDKKVYTGFYLAPQKTDNEMEPGEGYNGCFKVGFVYGKLNLSVINTKLNVDCVCGIGFNVWKQNEHEVSHWMPLAMFP